MLGMYLRYYPNSYRVLVLGIRNVPACQSVFLVFEAGQRQGDRRAREPPAADDEIIGIGTD